MTDLTYKQGDLEDAIVLRLADVTGATLGAAELRAADSVHLRFSSADRVQVFERAMTIADDGTVSYAWQVGDLDAVGTYLAEVVVTRSARPQTYPHDGYVTIAVLQKL